MLVFKSNLYPLGHDFHSKIFFYFLILGWEGAWRGEGGEGREGGVEGGGGGRG